jgi:proton-coupled amino acid transporter
MSSSSNTSPTASQPIVPNNSNMAPQAGATSANASPSTRPIGIGIASPPVPNIPLRNQDSPFGTSFRPRSLVGSMQERGELGVSYNRRKGLEGGESPAQGQKDRAVSSSTGKDLGLGEKRDPAGAGEAGGKVSALSARLGDEQDKQEEQRGRSGRSRSIRSREDNGKDKSPAGSNEAEDDTGKQDKKRADLPLPPFPRQISSNSTKNQNQTTSNPNNPGESGISSHVVTPTQIEEIPEEEKLRILRRHLVSAEERQAGEARRGSVVDHETPRGSIMQSQAQGGAEGAGSKSRKSSNRSGSLLPEFRNASGLNVPNDTVVLNDDEAGSSKIQQSGTMTGRSSRKGSMRLQEEESQDVFPMPYDALGGDVT